MAAELSHMVDFLWKPPKGAPGVKKRPLDRTLPENFKYFRNWGFTIYRTYYGTESDEHWNTLLDILRQQTCIALGYYESKEAREDDNAWKRYRKGGTECVDEINIMKKLFRLFPREDPSLLGGLDIRGIREVCLKEHTEAEKRMTGAFFEFVLVADEAVLKDIARYEFVVKAVGYDYDPKRCLGTWGWMRISTGDLLELWEMLFNWFILSNYKYMELEFRGPEESLENHVWLGDGSMPCFGQISQVQATETPFET